MTDHREAPQVWDVVVSYPSPYEEDARWLVVSLRRRDPALRVFWDKDYPSAEWASRVESAMERCLVFVALLPSARRGARRGGLGAFQGNELTRIQKLNEQSVRVVLWQRAWRTIVQPFQLENDYPELDLTHHPQTRQVEPWSRTDDTVSMVLRLARAARQDQLGTILRRSDAILAAFGKVALLIDDADDAEPSTARALYGTDALPEWWLRSASLEEACEHIEQLQRAFDAWFSRSERKSRDTLVDGMSPHAVVFEESFSEEPPVGMDSRSMEEEVEATTTDQLTLVSVTPHCVEPDDVLGPWDGPEPSAIIVLDRLLPAYVGEGPIAVDDILNEKSLPTGYLKDVAHRFRDRYRGLFKAHGGKIRLIRHTSFVGADGLLQSSSVGREAFIPRKRSPVFAVRQEIERLRLRRSPESEGGKNDLVRGEWLEFGPSTRTPPAKHSGISSNFNRALNLIETQGLPCYLIAGDHLSERTHPRCAGFSTLDELRALLGTDDTGDIDARVAEFNLKTAEGFIDSLSELDIPPALAQLKGKAIEALRHRDVGIGMVHLYAILLPFMFIYDCSFGGFLQRAESLIKSEGRSGARQLVNMRPVRESMTLGHEIRSIADEFEQSYPKGVFVLAGINPRNPCIRDSFGAFGGRGDVIWLHPSEDMPDELYSANRKAIMVRASPLAFLHDAYERYRSHERRKRQW